MMFCCFISGMGFSHKRVKRVKKQVEFPWHDIIKLIAANIPHCDIACALNGAAIEGHQELSW